MKSSSLVGLLKYAIGLGLLGGVLYMNWNPKLDSQGHEVSPGLKDIFNNPVNWIALAACFTLSFACLTLTLIRWFVLVRAIELPFTLREAIRLGMGGYTFNTILPSGVGGDVLIKAPALYRAHAGRRAAALATILVDRLVGLWIMFVMVAVLGGYFWLAGDPVVSGNEEMKALLNIPFTVVPSSVVLWLLLGLVPQTRMEKIRLWLERIPKVGSSLADLWNAVCIYRRKPKGVLTAILMSAVSCTGWVMAYHFAAHVFTVTKHPEDIATIGEHLLISPAGMALQAFVPTPGGVGGGELVFGQLYKLLGRPEAIGIVMCFTMRLISYALGMVSYLIYLRMSARKTPPGPAT